ncbi:MAG: 2-C-methyl-D-erythritol 2,4-cyclodiphosphate synthase [Bacilli bacterium]|nr:2-C-methyl-D-erythritol 2,4-cyclodiphosphate synthase [Bacilli bacterium]
MDYRIGFSKDIHRLVENRKLIIGGVVVPFKKGELAHSDGDVLYHALAESILGALALGDLGKHFPDTSDETLDMDSSVIVSRVVKMMFEKGYEVNNVDIFVSLERPKLKDYIESMRNNVAHLLQINIDQVSIKAGTNEKCGEVGKGEAIEATSMILLRKK